MTSERRALETYNEVRRVRTEFQVLVEASMLGLQPTTDELFHILKLMDGLGYQASYALKAVRRDFDAATEDRRRESAAGRLPPFDGVDDAQQAAQVVPAPAEPASVGEQVRQALAEGVRS